MFGNFDIASFLMQLLISVPIILIALSGHEFGHAWMSTKLGDPTPRQDGRLTLNPLAHLDPIGTLMMIVARVGWAKPVMVNPMYYKHRKEGMALVAAAGPLANLVMAVIGVFLLYVAYTISVLTGWNNTIIRTIAMIFQTFAVSNIALMLFNLIPISPLDGSKILAIILPDRIYYKVLQYERYGMIVLIAIILLSRFSGLGFFDTLLTTGINAIYNAISFVFEFFFNLIV